MIKNTQETMLDSTDLALLRNLQSDGRLSNVELARKINLSPPAALARMKRLEKEGYLRQYTAIVDREKSGYDLLCFIHISLQMHQVEQVEKFREATRQMPEVLECHHITGEYDYLLKVVLKNSKDLERFLVGKITPIPGVARIHTSLVLTEVKATMALPLE
ncbi:MAG: AsnC family transcriptional regulator [Anaerolineae bacterium]|nr:Leucine-responsive regulatory protein [Anaerolineales bacterium]RIK29350.1 MAG: AsnC family transcriptional regulator [Anaerolineae bacterium]WKZ42894.1 MAG: Lrp/AsnC family transcriptional regulator [Anaerolineales bacterium]WKZ49219.1 MAG: Lrp/AsnC family transcriptional regulator [Anaerolineales bacterium]